MFDTLKQAGVWGASMTILFENALPLIGQKVFNKKFRLWEARWNHMETTIKAKIDTISKKKKKIRILDIGCGAGDLIFFANNYAHKKGIKTESLGIDIDEDAVSFATQIAKEIGDKSKFMIGDILEGTITKKGKKVKLNEFIKKWGTPDVLICEGVLEWLPERNKMLKNVFSINSENIVLLSPSSGILNNLLPSIMMGVVKATGSSGHNGIEPKHFEKLIKENLPRTYKSSIKHLSVEKMKGSFMVLDAVKKK